MSKDYRDFYVNESNTPKLRIYSLMLGLFFLFSGINFILAYRWNANRDGSFTTSYLVMGIVLILITPIICIDKRKDNRGRGAVLAAILMHAVCTIGCAFVMRFSSICVLYVVELLICLLCWIISYSRFRYISKNAKIDR